ncbi:GatB/YqeY domain-containing protein [Kitasatospora sp. KL5]|uniref:GatB/YqeY domain-containing protein n=1 Tax=Kitasatospora sp. KL5 TaxID=3425125 RepID=UPI003D6FE1A6
MTSEPTTTDMPLRPRLRAALTAAMKARDRVAVDALRPTLAALDNAEAVERPEGADRNLAVELIPVGAGAAEVPRRELTEEQIVGIVRAEASERSEAAEAYERAGRADRAERLRAEAAVLLAHLA